MGAAYVFGAVVCAPPMDAHVVWADTRVRPYAMRRMAHIGGRCAHCRPWGAMICGVGGHTGPPAAAWPTLGGAAPTAAHGAL